MSDYENSLDSFDNNARSKINGNDTKKKMDQFKQMIKLCQTNKKFPQKYIEDMNKMYTQCSNEQKNSKHLCNLVLEGIDNISSTNNHAFQYAANVYNELLQLTKRDSASLQGENCVPSTSNGIQVFGSLASSQIKKVENRISSSNEIFNELIEKCYSNSNFPKSNIEVIDKLYKSLPFEFIESKHFVSLLKDTNEAIWPDSLKSSYIHIDNIYKQLLQFETSMKVQDRKISIENKDTNLKKMRKVKKLQKALKETRKRIKILDEQEMDINDDNEFEIDSAYILKDKFEKRALEIYKRLCKLRDEPDFLEEPPLRFKQMNNSLVNKTIEKFYNMNKVFPDYYEIYTLLKLLNEKKKLNWNENKLRNISKEAFQKLGHQLKIQRENEFNGRLSNFITEKDPAEVNVELKKKLEESNKKFNAEMNALTEKFEKKQEYAEETEGSNLENSDCENSSEDDYHKRNQNQKNDFKIVRPVLVKRKRELTNKSENDEPLNKTQKTMYMESFNLTPCAVVLEKLDDVINGETSIIAEKVTDKISKTENINKSDENLKNINVIERESMTDTEGGDTLVIDEEMSVIDDSNINIISKESPKNDIEKSGSNEDVMNSSIVSINSEESDSVIPEPEIILIEGPVITDPEVIIPEESDPTDNESKKVLPKVKSLGEDVIEIIDDSDIKVISVRKPPKVPVYDKKSLDSIIKSMDFNKKYNWNNQSTPRPSLQNVPSREFGRHNLGYSNQNSNNEFVNRWIINSVVPPRPINFQIRQPNHIRHTLMSHRIQPTIQKRTTETKRQVTHHYMNTAQQQRRFMNVPILQQVLQQQVTTMTTTTTVQQVVQQASASSQPKRKQKPELIELD